MSCLVNKLATWLSSVKNVGCLKCKVTTGPINISCKDDYSSLKMTKGRVILFKIQGINLESWKTGRLDWLPTFLPRSCQAQFLAQSWEGRANIVFSLKTSRTLFFSFLKQWEIVLQISVERTIRTFPRKN